jgi:hypothetical protein
MDDGYPDLNNPDFDPAAQQTDPKFSRGKRGKA